MHVNHRFFFALVGCATGLSCTDSALPCEDIAILSRDARFMVLSGDTLDEKDVGNLWWLGIRGVDKVIANSTLTRAAVLSDTRVDIATGTSVAGDSALAILRDLGRSWRSPAEMPLTTSAELTDAWWIDSSPESRLLAARSSGGQQHAIVAYSQDLQLQATVPVGGGGFALGVACETESETVVGGLRDRLVISNDGAGRVEPLAQPGTPDERRLLGASPNGCVGLVAESVPEVQEGDINAAEMIVRTIDLMTNELGTGFRTRRMAEKILFEGGRGLLEQELAAAPEGAGGYRVTTTGRLRVLDTRNGALLQSVELEASGQISRLFCRGESERVVLGAPGKLYLVELESLSIVATRDIPFDSYSVF